MSRIDRDIAFGRFNRARAINDFAVCCALGIFLHPQAITGKDIAFLVVDFVRQKMHIACGIEQCGIEDRPTRIQH